MNKKAAKSSLPFCVLVPLLKDVAELVDMQIVLVNDFLRRRHRSGYIQANKTIHQVWDHSWTKMSFLHQIILNTFCRKRRLIGAVSRTHRMKRLVPCRCLDGHVKDNLRNVYGVGIPSVVVTTSSVRQHIYDWNIVNCVVNQPIHLNFYRLVPWIGMTVGWSFAPLV